MCDTTRFQGGKARSFAQFAVLLLTVVAHGGGIHQTASAELPVRADAKVRALSVDFEFTEGPAADHEGNLYFTDQPNDRILRWSVTGELTTFLQPCGRANGLFFDCDGNLLACADERNELWLIKPDGTHRVLAGNFQGKRLNGPNDLWVHPSGGIYFTDPFYRRSYWKHEQPELDQQCVYFLPSGSGELVRVADGLEQPNGIIGTPDGKSLYVSDIRGGKTYRYAIHADGTLGDRQLFCELGSDGMTIDHLGNVYLTGRGVTVFSPDGTQLQNIAVPERWTANVAFGGADRRTLFITASRGLYSVEAEVHGVSPCDKSSAR